MIVFDRKHGMASDVGEFWARNAGIGKDTIVEMSLDDKKNIDFAFESMNIVIPIDRLKRLLEES